VENISLRCRAHNVYESELVFGRFEPSIVRERAENYAVSREIAPFRNGGAATAGQATGQQRERRKMPQRHRDTEKGKRRTTGTGTRRASRRPRRGAHGAER
jgi:hypothetical protein